MKDFLRRERPSLDLVSQTPWARDRGRPLFAEKSRFSAGGVKGEVKRGKEVGEGTGPEGERGGKKEKRVGGKGPKAHSKNSDSRTSMIEVLFSGLSRFYAGQYGRNGVQKRTKKMKNVPKCTKVTVMHRRCQDYRPDFWCFSISSANRLPTLNFPGFWRGQFLASRVIAGFESAKLPTSCFRPEMVLGIV